MRNISSVEMFCVNVCEGKVTFNTPTTLLVLQCLQWVGRLGCVGLTKYEYVYETGKGLVITGTTIAVRGGGRWRAWLGVDGFGLGWAELGRLGLAYLGFVWFNRLISRLCYDKYTLRTKPQLLLIL